MYRNLKFDKEMGDKDEPLKQAAKVEYLMKYYQPGDIVEAFGINPAEPTTQKWIKHYKYSMIEYKAGNAFLIAFEHCL